MVFPLLIGVYKIETAVFIGRFQPFHKGHHKTVEKYKEEFETLKIVVGSSNKSRTKKNPLKFEERKKLIEECHQLKIIPLEDEDRGEEGYKDWTKKLVKKTNADVVITRNNLVQELIKKYTDARIQKQKLYMPKKCSGTKIRKKIRQGKEWQNLVPECNQQKIKKYQKIITQTG